MNANEARSYAALLTEPAFDAAGRDTLRRLGAQALLPLGIVALLLGSWSAIAPLAGAIVAPARLKVELNRKTVQHQEGGIVQEILARDGQRVRAGDPLIVIGDVRSDASLRLVRDQLRSEEIRRARLSAEAALHSQFGVTATAETTEHVARERALFVARRRMLDEHVASLEAQMREARAQAAALEAQIRATEESAALSAEEVAIHDKLARQGFISRTRLIALERTAADYRARVGEYGGELAAARQRVGELQARIVQARNLYQSQATDELRQVSAAIRELEQRVRPSEDQVERQVVRSPVDGEVMAMRVTAIGAAVGPREPLLDIVPGNEKIVVEARIRPQDIDHVRTGGGADVRVGALQARSNPLLPGKVVFVSADRVPDPAGHEGWYVATIELDDAARSAYADLRLSAGMPAEVYVRTPARTLLDYLIAPLHVFGDRAMREP